MSILAGIGKRNTVGTVQIKPVERSVLERALLYAERLVLPEPSGKAMACLAEQKRADGESSGIYCIRFLSDGTKAGDMDAGYLAGQVASFLRFQGMNGLQIRRIQESGRADSRDGADDSAQPKMRCRAVLVSGEQERSEKKRRRSGAREEDPGIYTERRENWSDELLAYTRRQYPGTYRRLNTSCREGWIHFSGKKWVGKHAIADEFEAGVAAAQIMAAAEMLWVDLELSRVQTPKETEYLFSVRRKAGQVISGMNSRVAPGV